MTRATAVMLSILAGQPTAGIAALPPPDGYGWLGC
jgi:hypothetical protein